MHFVWLITINNNIRLFIFRCIFMHLNTDIFFLFIFISIEFSCIIILLLLDWRAVLKCGPICYRCVRTPLGFLIKILIDFSDNDAINVLRIACSLNIILCVRVSVVNNGLYKNLSGNQNYDRIRYYEVPRRDLHKAI